MCHLNIQILIDVQHDLYSLNTVQYSYRRESPLRVAATFASWLVNFPGG